MINAKIDTKTSHVTDKCFVITGKDILKYIHEETVKFECGFDRVMSAYSNNNYVYNSLIKSICRGKQFIFFQGYSLSGFITGGKEKFIDRICDDVIHDFKEYTPELKRKLLVGEFALSLIEFPKDFIDTDLKDELRDDFKKVYFDKAMLELHTALYMVCFKSFIRFLPDCLIENILNRMQIPYDIIYPDTNLAQSKNMVSYMYTLCGD